MVRGSRSCRGSMKWPCSRADDGLEDAGEMFGLRGAESLISSSTFRYPLYR